MNYQFSNLLGAPFRGGNLVLHGSSLLFSPVGNRVSITDLHASRSHTLPCQNASNIAHIAVSPNGALLLSVDDNGKAILINVSRKVILHRFSFKEPISSLLFSPDGRFFAAGVGKLVQVWQTPGVQDHGTFAPFQLHKTYAGPQDRITCLAWSPDSQWLLAGSRDLTLRVFSLQPLKGYKPTVLAGFREPPVAAFFFQNPDDGFGAYGVSRDGALFVWTRAAADGGEALNPTQPHTWELARKHFFLQAQTKVASAAFHPASGNLLVGFSTGLFGLYGLPGFSTLQLLSVSSSALSSAGFSAGGDWVCLGCRALGQVLVWEWRSETYIWKQQGHGWGGDVKAMAFSRDGALMATGGDDGKVKVWNVGSGFCFVTLADHSAPVTAVAFLPSATAVASASLDGTVRAWDLLRYRNFRTFTTPEPRQLAALAVHASGDMLAAASSDTFQVFLWSMKSGRLLEILSGHEGPVHSLAFSPTEELLASASWDRTVRLWPILDQSRAASEALPHAHDVLCLAFRPDGRQLAAATLDGSIHLWDPREGKPEGVLEAGADARAGRAAHQRTTAGGGGGGWHSLCYTADGAMLLAAGKGRFVCCYDVEDRVLLRRFELTANQSLDGILEHRNSRRITDAGPLDLLDLEEEEEGGEEGPGQRRGDLGQGLPGASTPSGRSSVRAWQVAVSPGGGAWGCCCSEGVVMYSRDDSLAFDPTDLEMHVTPQAVHSSIASGNFSRALLLALRLNEPPLIRVAVEAVPPGDVPLVAPTVPRARLASLLSQLASYLDDSPHLEFVLTWCKELLVFHGRYLQSRSFQQQQQILPAMRALQKGLTRLHEDLSQSCATNTYMLEYLTSVGSDSAMNGS